MKKRGRGWVCFSLRKQLDSFLSLILGEHIHVYVFVSPVQCPLIWNMKPGFSWFILLLSLRALFFGYLSLPLILIYEDSSQYCWRDWQTLECRTSYMGSIGWRFRSILGFLLGGHQGQGSLALSIAIIGPVYAIRTWEATDHSRLDKK